MAACQDLEGGGWPGPDKHTGKKYFRGGVFGPSEVQSNGGEAMPWFFGRLRKEPGAVTSSIRIGGSLVHVWTRLWQETKDPLWKAKADGLVWGILDARDPVDGLFPTDFTRESAGGAYQDSINAAYHLTDYSRLTAARP